MPGAAGTGTDIRYSYDAARFPLRYAESCRAEDRRLAAAVLVPLSREDRVPTALDLDGAAIEPEEHPLGYLARAASSAAAGHQREADHDAERASAFGQDHATYNGAAWTALGRLMLETDELGGCVSSAA